jgi:hypothetical protein
MDNVKYTFTYVTTTENSNFLSAKVYRRRKIVLEQRLVEFG